RKAFDDVARRWSAWWKDNWNGFVTDASFAEVRLPASKEETSLKRFLAGPDIKTSSGFGEVVLSPVEDGRNCALNMALNKRLDLPNALSESRAASNAFEKVSSWAARA